MKSYDDITERVFSRGDEILRKRQKRTAVIKRTSLAVSGMCAAVLVCFGIWRDNDIKNSINDFHDKSNIVMENDDVPKATTEYSQQTTLSETSTTSVNVTNIPILSAMTTQAVTSEKKEFSENTVIFTTILNPVYSANSTKAQTKLAETKTESLHETTQTILGTALQTNSTGIQTELTETKTESLHETTQTIISTAFQTNSTETNTGFLTQTTTTTSENTDEEGGLYMKKLTSFFTSAVVLAASATPIIGHAEYKIDTSRYWPGEKAMFAAMDSGELDTDIDGNGVVDALDGYLFECYCFNKGAAIDLGFNIPDDINSRIEAIADYDGNGEVDNDDLTSWVRHFIVNRNLKAELFDYDYYVSEYVSDDSTYISEAKSWFKSELYRNMNYLRAEYYVVADMYKNGMLDLDANGNGQLDMEDFNKFYIYHDQMNTFYAYQRTENILSDKVWNICDNAHSNYCSALRTSPDYFTNNEFFYCVTLCILENIEIKPEYFTAEYYEETYGKFNVIASVMSSYVKNAAAALGLKEDKNAWLKFNHDDLYEFFDSYCNDVENGIRPAPDVNMDGVVDYNDYFTSNIYLEDLICSNTSDGSILPADIWENLEQNCDFNGNGTSKDIYDILTVQLYVVKYADRIDNFDEAYNKYVESLGGISEISVNEISYEDNVKILSTFEMKSNAVYGDANCDGFINMGDVTSIIQHIGNKDEYCLSEQGIINADCYNTGDGITAMDAVAVQMLKADMIDSLPFNE